MMYMYLLVYNTVLVVPHVYNDVPKKAMVYNICGLVVKNGSHFSNKL